MALRSGVATSWRTVAAQWLQDVARPFKSILNLTGGVANRNTTQNMNRWQLHLQTRAAAEAGHIN